MQCLPFLTTLSRSRRRPRTVHSAGECRARRGRSPSCTHTIFRESRPSYTSPDRRRQAPSDTSPHCRPHPQSDRSTRRIVSSRPKAHKEAAKLLIVRNEITCLLTSIKLKEKSVSEPEEGYRKLVDKANEIYMAVPTTTDQAVKMAKDALQVTEDNTFSEEEIDSYLPPALKKEGKNELSCIKAR